MVRRELPHLSQRDAKIIESATKPSAPVARALPRWLVAALLIAAPVVWVVFLSNLNTIDRGLDAVGFKSLANRLLPSVEFVRLYQWHVATFLLLLLVCVQQAMLRTREKLIAKLYWHAKKLASRSTKDSDE